VQGDVARNDERETQYWLLVTEDECRALMAGYVPERVREMARMVDWSLETGPLDYVGRREAQQRRG
jgi:hypothetical protein